MTLSDSTLTLIALVAIGLVGARDRVLDRRARGAAPGAPPDPG